MAHLVAIPASSPRLLRGGEDSRPLLTKLVKESSDVFSFGDEFGTL